MTNERGPFSGRQSAFSKMECYLSLAKARNDYVTMDSKTLTTIAAVILCVLFFPLLIGIAGGLAGIFGSVIGGLFGFVGGIFGGIFGLLGGIIGAICGAVGWLFDGIFHFGGPFHFGGGRLIALFIVVAILVMIARPDWYRRR